MQSIAYQYSTVSGERLQEKWVFFLHVICEIVAQKKKRLAVTEDSNENIKDKQGKASMVQFQLSNEAPSNRLLAVLIAFCCVG